MITTDIKPDILIDYFDDRENTNPMVVVYVRPETNEVQYEKALILGVSPYADVVYLANLNGKVFLQNALILDHYASQYRFSINAGNEIEQYPEMVEQFEKHFGVNFDKDKIVGSFDAMPKLDLTADDMFDIIVDSKDFLNFYGQTIKKIKGYYVVNYNIPALVKRYTPDVNIFVMAARSKTPDCKFEEINQSIFEQMEQNVRTPIVDEDLLKELKWNEKIKRTYHISKNHIMAMFDMMDFIFRSNGERIGFIETPLGRRLVEDLKFTEDMLFKLKEHPIVYIKEKQKKKKLVNIINYARDKTMEESVEIIGSIVF
ncbi:MAG TPA: hypothetical protein PLG34_05775 [Spirochaetota bacterium]|jgi:hypothetical protein|nr:MAG: hypothetical protein BWX91_01282 [Spirochaetes bacterium ADurb.Bin133]HNZ27396.1 hypothetical protein [Spirochaetota bacterium]HPY87471.1 hypothetical protein [Spirochaetota bacterium]HQB61155.1 hypothetical protein [Spirochaetota bacterium]